MQETHFGKSQVFKFWLDLEISVIQNFLLFLSVCLVRWSLGFDQDNHNTAPTPRRAEAEETLGSLNHEKNSTFQQEKHW